MSNDNDQNDTPKLPTIQKRIINAAVEIEQDDPLGIVYQHSLFCQVALPRSRPEGRIFERAYRNGSVRIESGVLWDGRQWVEQPVPAGAKPRLALMHIHSAAVKARCPVVEVDRCPARELFAAHDVTDMFRTLNLANSCVGVSDQNELPPPYVEALALAARQQAMRMAYDIKNPPGGKHGVRSTERPATKRRPRGSARGRWPIRLPGASGCGREEQ